MSEKEKTMKAAGCVEVFLELLKVSGVSFCDWRVTVDESEYCS